MRRHLGLKKIKHLKICISHCDKPWQTRRHFQAFQDALLRHTVAEYTHEWLQYPSCQPTHPQHNNSDCAKPFHLTYSSTADHAPPYTPIARQAGKPSSRTYCSPRPDRWCSWALVRDRDVTTLAVAHISSSASDNVDPGDALRTQRQPWNWSRGPSSDSAVDVEVSRGSPKAGPPPPPPAGMPPVHWQSRTLGHLQQQCGRFLLRSP